MSVISACIKCGSVTKVTVHSGDLYCRNCIENYAVRCSARAEPFGRCRLSTMSGNLCSRHAGMGVPAEEWVLCSCEVDYRLSEDKVCNRCEMKELG